MNVRLPIIIMRRLPWQCLLPLFLLPGILFAGDWSLRPASVIHHPSSLFLYPLASAGILHWLLNAVAWIQLWQWSTPRRLLTAYLCAVLIGYAATVPGSFAAWSTVPGSFAAGSHPVCGFSVIIFFFIGLTLPYQSRTGMLSLLAIVGISFLLPHIAASFHAAALVCGLAYHLVARLHNS